MTLKVLFEQLKDLRKRISIPVLLMGYVNPVLQYGVEKFCQSAYEVGIDGVIVPDLPMYEYEELYKNCFLEHKLSNVFLVTPQTSEERIRKIDKLTNGFIYLLSTSATTGKILSVSTDIESYFARIKNMKLSKPTMIGFGISDNKSFSKASEYANGAIVGSAFVKLLGSGNGYLKQIPEFIKSIKG
jgi:tryptophan synthase alpha chain